MEDWISVKDSLPKLMGVEGSDGEKESVLVLVFFEGHSVSAKYNKGDDDGECYEYWYCPLISDCIDEVTHWQELKLPNILQKKFNQDK